MNVQDGSLEFDTRAITIADVSRLLLVGCMTRDRPLDHVIGRLAEPDGSSWLSVAVNRLCGPGLERFSGARRDPPSIAELRLAKNHAKAAMATAATREDVAAATVSYLFSVAAAAVGHGEHISRRPPEELAEMMAELGAVAPGGWADVLRDAAVRLAASGGPQAAVGPAGPPHSASGNGRVQ